MSGSVKTITKTHLRVERCRVQGVGEEKPCEEIFCLHILPLIMTNTSTQLRPGYSLLGLLQVVFYLGELALLS